MPGDEDAFADDASRVTIYDVAAAAGVSASTVSRAFARPGRVSSATAARVLQVAEDLGYRRDPLFRPDAPTRSGLISITFADITNPAFFGLIRGAEDATTDTDYTLVLSDIREDAAIERREVERMLSKVDGMVITSTRLNDADLRRLARQVPLALVNRVINGVPCVVPDTARGMRRAVEHLAELGHTRITYVAGPENSWTNGMRWRAVYEACIELELIASRTPSFPPTIVGGSTAVASLAEKRSTAMLCYNDLMAVGVIRGLRQAGVRVPSEVSVVGVDNTIVAELIDPALTTVASPLRQLGRMATQTVMGLVEGHQWKADQALVAPTQLVVRQSTAPAPGCSPR